MISEYNLERDEIGESLENYYQVPYMSYDDGLNIPRGMISKVSNNYLLKQLWVPVEGNQDEVTILIDDPIDSDRIMETQRVLNAKNFVFKVGLATDIRAYLGVKDDLSGGGRASEVLENLKSVDLKREPGSRYFCESLFWASKPKQTAKTSRDRLCLRRPDRPAFVA
ncbi:hypothetical protein [Candidatus Reidiella endopervernicosa]|uniref:Type II secretion system protein GspE N-terminal domain-containing protein n=1 Tax=Candidatus Reidiella endopervernicosa TaxID=2738883 RepID=A0A6N0HXH1_9GAMM|nr:hypothetical protein [Candidatus Reidiella endopervernicosa]QKQ26991.1 hypothetical protein HUE57_12415 [Candidatus Reidiella endopervernicosa]